MNVNDKDIIPIRFDKSIGRGLRRAVVDSDDYSTLSGYVNDAVKEKIEKKCKEEEDV